MFIRTIMQGNIMLLIVYEMDPKSIKQGLTMLDLICKIREN